MGREALAEHAGHLYGARTRSSDFRTSLFDIRSLTNFCQAQSSAALLAYAISYAGKVSNHVHLLFSSAGWRRHDIKNPLLCR
jgi:hypothetical protein